MSDEPKEFARLDRHSAGAQGSSVNAKPKKDGAGGKFTMGKAGDENGAVDAIDKGDPMYDSDQDNDMEQEDTIFDKIVRGEIPSKKVYEDDKVLAFHDVNPQAPVHVVVIPKKRDGLTQLKYAKQKHQEILGHMMVKVAHIAAELNLREYRLVVNDGQDAGQTVFHLHLHILSGREFTWPPG